MNTHGLALVVLVALVTACAPAEPSSSVRAPGNTAVTSTTTRVTTSQNGSSCFATLAVSGDFEGQVGGNVSGLVRRIGTADTGVEIELSFDMPQGGKPARFAFNIGDPDGHAGSKPIQASFSQFQPIAVVGGWLAGRDPGTATLADDGSSASFDMTFATMSSNRHARVVGSIRCPVS